MSAPRWWIPALLLAAAAPGWSLTPPAKDLEERMRAAGLERVASLGESGPQVRGLLVGEGEQAVLLFAGCGPGGEAARRAALIAIGDLARTPRRHTLEVVLCPAGGASADRARLAAESWLALHPEREERQAVLAALHLEPGALAAGGAAGLLRAAEGPDGRRLPPAWLAHVALEGARAAGSRLAIGDPRWPLPGQLLGRHGRARTATGAEAFLAAGMPALTLAGEGPRSGWASLLAATVRRLDALAGRPRDDDVYLALGGRVWSRRDLYWAGLGVFVALVVGGLPGRWRGTASDQRQARGRRYLPGFLLRMLFLALALTLPVSTLLLMAPAALLTLAPARRRGVTLLLRVLSAAPVLLFAGYWALELAGGRMAAWPAQPARLLLVLAGVGLAIGAIGRGRAEQQ